jgi:hypothetical protein
VVLADHPVDLGANLTRSRMLIQIKGISPPAYDRDCRGARRGQWPRRSRPRADADSGTVCRQADPPEPGGQRGVGQVAQRVQRSRTWVTVLTR